MAQKITTLNNMPAEQKKILLAALAEAKKRGVDISKYLKKTSVNLKWPVDPYGYFVREDGKQFTPNGGQEGFITTRAIFSGLISGRGGGKSASGAQKALRKIKDGEPGAIINPDFENFKLSTWPEFCQWIPWDMVVPSQRYRKELSWQPTQPFTMAFMNGVRVYCKGLKDPESARGPNINWLWYDEAGRDRDGLGWKLAVAGVRIGKSPQAWLTTTPKGVQNWIYKLLIDKDIPEDSIEEFAKIGGFYNDTNTNKDLLDKLVAVFFSSIEDNKDNLSPTFYAQMLATYPPGWMREQELFGRFIQGGGTLGNRDWFIGKIVGMAPVSATLKVRFWDLAASEKKLTGKHKSDDPDSTCGTLLSYDKIGNYFIEDQVEAQVSWTKIKQLIIDTAHRDGMTVPIWIEQEGAAGGKNQIAEIASMEELAGYSVFAKKPEGDKIQRALTWFSKADLGLIYLVVGEWNNRFLDQVNGFPNLNHDDRIDSVSGAFSVIGSTKWKKIEFLAITIKGEEKKDERVNSNSIIQA